MFFENTNHEGFFDRKLWQPNNDRRHYLKNQTKIQSKCQDNYYWRTGTNGKVDGLSVLEGKQKLGNEERSIIDNEIHLYIKSLRKDTSGPEVPSLGPWNELYVIKWLFNFIKNHIIRNYYLQTLDLPGDLCFRWLILVKPSMTFTSCISYLIVVIFVLVEKDLTPTSTISRFQSSLLMQKWTRTSDVFSNDLWWLLPVISVSFLHTSLFFLLSNKFMKDYYIKPLLTLTS